MNPAKKKVSNDTFILLGLGGAILSLYFYNVEGQTGYLIVAFFLFYVWFVCLEIK